MSVNIILCFLVYVFNCLLSHTNQVDESALFDSASIYDTGADITALNIVRCCVWLLYSVWFLWTAIVFMSLIVIELGIWKAYFKGATTVDATGTVEINLADIITGSRNSNPKTMTQREDSNENRKPKFKPIKACCNKTSSLYFQYIKWYQRHFGADTRNWFVLLFIRELIEIVLQTLAGYNYNGFNVFSPNETILAFKQNDIKFFFVLLSLNCILIGILWLFYVCFYKYCHGRSFKQIIFFIDTIFDTLYALFPIIVITNENGFNLQLSVAVLQTSNTLS